MTVETTWRGAAFGKLRARKTTVGTNEKFQLCWYTSEGYYTLKALANGRNVTAETGYSGDWNGVLRASVTTVGTNQKFRITAGSGGSSEYSKIESVANGRYVSCEATWSGDIKGILRAQNVSAGTYERFQFPSALSSLPSPGPPPAGPAEGQLDGYPAEATSGARTCRLGRRGLG